VKIDIPQLLLHLRAEITEGPQIGEVTRKRSASERFAFRLFVIMMTRPWLYRLSSKLGRLFQRSLVRDGRIGRISGGMARFAQPLGAWTSGRDLRPLEGRSFRELWQSELAGKR
jgi:L-lactate dehydrogenase complex protein LldF